MHFEIKTLILP